MGSKKFPWTRNCSTLQEKLANFSKVENNSKNFQKINIFSELESPTLVIHFDGISKFRTQIPPWNSSAELTFNGKLKKKKKLRFSKEIEKFQNSKKIVKTRPQRKIVENTKKAYILRPGCKTWQLCNGPDWHFSINVILMTSNHITMHKSLNA